METFLQRVSDFVGRLTESNGRFAELANGQQPVVVLVVPGGGGSADLAVDENRGEAPASFDFHKRSGISLPGEFEKGDILAYMADHGRLVPLEDSTPASRSSNSKPQEFKPFIEPTDIYLA